MILDIAALRSETVGCTRVIHFNNAGASLMPDTVWNEVTKFSEQEALWGGYEAAQRRHKDLEETYHSIAALIHAKPEEIALFENATTAWNMAFSSIPFKDGDRILTSVSEYASNYMGYLHLKRRVNVSLEVIPNDSYGQTSVEALEDMIDNRVRLISITHIPTNSGLVNPVESIGEVANKYGCLYLLDACQSVGHYPVDVQKIGCDMLSSAGRKYLRGPRGTGFLYVNAQKLPELIPPFPDLHSAEWMDENTYAFREDARKFESWEFNYASVAGLNSAVKYANAIGIETIWKRIQYVAGLLRRRLKEISGISVHDIGQIKSGIVTFTHSDFSAEEIQQYLSVKNINVSVSTRDSTLLDMTRRNLEAVVRASVHYYNTEKEIEILAEALRNLGN